MEARRSVAVLAMVSSLLGRPAVAAEKGEADAVRAHLRMGGHRLRIVTATGVRFEGTLASAEDGSVTIADERGLALALEPSQISRLEVGVRRSPLHGALRGALIGGTAIAVMGLAVYAADRSQQREGGLCGDLTTGLSTCLTAGDIPSAALGGALIGALWGLGRPGVAWKPLRSDALKVAVSPVAGGGVGARATISF